MKLSKQPTQVHVLDDLVEVPEYDPVLWKQVQEMEALMRRKVEAAKSNFLGVMAEEALAQAENIKSPGALLPLINAALESDEFTQGAVDYRDLVEEDD